MRWLLLVLCACSTGEARDAGTDAAVEAAPDLCDLDAFFASGGAGKPCPFASPRMCFQAPTCAATYCRCVASASGPVWQCMTGCAPEAGAD